MVRNNEHKWANKIVLPAVNETTDSPRAAKDEAPRSQLPPVNEEVSRSSTQDCLFVPFLNSITYHVIILCR